MTDAANRAASTSWIMLLTLASTATTLALACATPFPALAALAAAHMRRRDGAWLMLAAWIASQAVGFGLLGYPHDPATLVRGGAIGAAAVAGVLAAHRAARPFAGTAARLAAGYLAAFAGFKAALALAALVVPGLGGAFLPHVLGRQLLRDAVILVGLYALYRGLIALGMPTPAPRRAVAA